jgi:phosphatidylglycerophosphate synthase
MDASDDRRRPIAARSWSFSQRATAFLVARGAGANAISVWGMLAGLLAGGLFAATSLVERGQWALWLGAALCIQLRLLANMLDGMVAIARGATSKVGELYNEIPDRVSDTATLVGLGYAAGGAPMLGWAAALIAMTTAYVRATGVAAGAKPDFGGPMAKPHRMALGTATAIACAFTTLYGAGIVHAWELGLPAWCLIVVIIGSAWTALARLLRIASELRRRP